MINYDSLRPQTTDPPLPLSKQSPTVQIVYKHTHVNSGTQLTHDSVKPYLLTCGWGLSRHVELKKPNPNMDHFFLPSCRDEWSAGWSYVAYYLHFQFTVSS